MIVLWIEDGFSGWEVGGDEAKELVWEDVDWVARSIVCPRCEGGFGGGAIVGKRGVDMGLGCGAD